MTPEIKAKLLEKYRTFNVDHIDWWDCVYEQFQEDMKTVGIRVDEMYFSGFWSQGDGACFEGVVENWDLFLKSLGHDNEYLINEATYNWTFSSKHQGHYYHENCVAFFDDSISLPNHADDEDWAHYYLDGKEELRKAVIVSQLAQYSGIESDFVEAFKRHMRDLYSRLEDEYDNLTSDEAVLEALEANDMLEEAINELTEHEHA